MPHTHVEGRDFLDKAEWIRWTDACGVSGWQSIDRASEQGVDTIDTLGFVLREDKECVVLAQNIEHENNCDHVMVIPKARIVARWTIR